MNRRNRFLAFFALSLFAAWSPLWSPTAAPLVLLGTLFTVFYWDREILAWIDAGDARGERDENAEESDGTPPSDTPTGGAV